VQKTHAPDTAQAMGNVHRASATVTTAGCLRIAHLMGVMDIAQAMECVWVDSATARRVGWVSTAASKSNHAHLDAGERVTVLKACATARTDGQALLVTLTHVQDTAPHMAPAALASVSATPTSLGLTAHVTAVLADPAQGTRRG